MKFTVLTFLLMMGINGYSQFLNIALSNNTNSSSSSSIRSLQFNNGNLIINTSSGSSSQSMSNLSNLSFGSQILPVTLLQFDAIIQQKHIDLTWQTAKEMNNDYFEIEKSSDGLTWSSIGSVQGNGNSNHINTYSYQDIHPLAKNFYRLKQVDIDGQSEYSSIISCLFKPTDIVIYPNPIKDFVTINFELEQDELIIINTYSLEGTLVSYTNTKGTIGQNTIQLNLSELMTGIYFLSINGQKFKINKQH